MVAVAEPPPKTTRVLYLPRWATTRVCPYFCNRYVEVTCLFSSVLYGTVIELLVSPFNVGS